MPVSRLFPKGLRPSVLPPALRSAVRRFVPAGLLLLLSACGLTRCAPEPLGAAEVAALYATPAPPPEGPLRVFHIGHSLVGRDMPAMLQQLAQAGVEAGTLDGGIDGGAADEPNVARPGYESQLGWGAPMRSHWDPDEPINGFETENDHPRYRDAREAVTSGGYDALVLTEMVEIRDAIEYHDSWRYLMEWARAAWAANPETRVFFYESWHGLKDEEGWLTRLDRDLELYWEREILDRALAHDDIDRPIHMIPGGQVMAAVTRALEARAAEGAPVTTPAGPLVDAQGLFADEIHFNDYGAYLIALTHYAVIYGRDPAGLPHALTRGDGAPADDPGAEAAALMQEIVWQVVRGYPRTGVAPAP